MVQKPEIQYIGQFYVYGSEAREAALKEKKAKFALPKPKMQKIQKIYIDPVALCGIMVAMVLLVVMAVGAVQLKESWHAYDVMQEHLSEIKRENAMIEHAYRTSFDQEYVRGAAQAMGMIPADEAQTMTIKVTIPQPKKAPSAWDNFRWFMRGLVD